jgi:hypothetical protein
MALVHPDLPSDLVIGGVKTGEFFRRQRNAVIAN